MEWTEIIPGLKYGISLPNEFYLDKLNNDNNNVLFLKDYKIIQKLKEFAISFFNDSNIFSDEELKIIFDTIESQNLHFETEDGKIITIEEMRVLRLPSLIIVPNSKPPK